MSIYQKTLVTKHLKQIGDINMEKNLNLAGRVIFAIPLLAFGMGHFMKMSKMAAWVPIPFAKEFFVILTGVALVAAAVSLLIKKHTFYAMLGLALMLLIFAFSMALPMMMGSMGEAMKQAGMSNFFKDMGLAGAAIFMASKHIPSKK